MTKEQIKAVLDRVLTWPADRQEMAADVLLEIEAQQQEQFYEPSDEEWAAIQEGRAQARRGEFASDEEMEAFWKRHGL